MVQVRCICGKEAAMDVGSFGRSVVCGACRGRYVAVWGIDPKSKKASPIVFDATPGTPRGFRIPAGMFELPCPCGQRLYARPRQTGKRVQCPVCAIWLKLEHSKDPQTLQTRIRVVKSRLNQLPAAPPSPPSPPSPPPLPAEDNVQFILCSCGESLRVDGTEARCPACGTRMRLETKHGVESSYVVVDPQQADRAQPSEKRGIDEDLSLDDFT